MYEKNIDALRYNRREGPQLPVACSDLRSFRWQCKERWLIVQDSADERRDQGVRAEGEIIVECQRV